MTKNTFVKSSDFLNFDIDHIELFGTFRNYEELFRGIDGDNSNFRELGEYTLEKTDNIKNYHYKISIRKDNKTFFAWYRGTNLNEYIETRDYFIVYGTAFRYMKLYEIVEYIEENIVLDFPDLRKGKKTYTLKRLDLALDIRKNIGETLKQFKELKQKGSKFYGENGEIQTSYIGEKKLRNNKAILIRIYDKIADIYQKEKQRYYPDYLKEAYVTRLEIEFRSDLLKTLTLSQLHDRSYVFGLFCLYISKHTHIFDNYQKEGIEKLKRLDKKINLEDLNYRQLTRNRYVNTFLGYARKFKYLNGCPIDILLRENIFKEQTLQDILIASPNGVFDLQEYRNGVTQKNLSMIFADNFTEQHDDSGGV